jgi:hypothetical protein
MRYLKYAALMAVMMVPLAYSQAQVSVGIGVGPVGVVVGHPYLAGPPVCAYGYYDYYPYTCAPYGYYGPEYFVDGVFIGAGPWYHYGHPEWFWDRGYRGWERGYARGWGYGHGYERYARGWGYGHEGYARGYAHEGYGRAYAGGRGFAERGFHGGNSFHGGNGFRGGNSFHGGGEFHGGRGFRGGAGFHGGGRR